MARTALRSARLWPTIFVKSRVCSMAMRVRGALQPVDSCLLGSVGWYTVFRVRNVSAHFSFVVNAFTEHYYNNTWESWRAMSLTG